ncbi:hypothetical protein MNQ95_02155 [Pseudoxanthomonas daejeonensis]|uniref:hypothetical protein n=1 Tax=Pseudoxanthomonas daejeonensis TaxID=266062 RepID=UPI001F5470BB|nr:hypothetical protein [Pseudoxanthomonas daejeonensis]UNK57936.1 hypothetical protein MNQ95_02155 [Pseudoxanthomonas daejeonensis]
MKAVDGDMPVAFGERFARNAVLGMAGLGLFIAVAVVAQGNVVAFIGSVIVQALSHFFRRRALYDAQRGRHALEDERDRTLLARGDGMFRLVASTWMVGLAIALAVPSLREMLLAPSLRVSGMLLLGVVVANIAGHGAVSVHYRRNRA